MHQKMVQEVLFGLFTRHDTPWFDNKILVIEKNFTKTYRLFTCELKSKTKLVNCNNNWIVQNGLEWKKFVTEHIKMGFWSAARWQPSLGQDKAIYDQADMRLALLVWDDNQVVFRQNSFIELFIEIDGLSNTFVRSEGQIYITFRDFD